MSKKKKSCKCKDCKNYKDCKKKKKAIQSKNWITLIVIILSLLKELLKTF